MPVLSSSNNFKERNIIKVSGIAKKKVYSLLFNKSKKVIRGNLDFLNSVTMSFKNLH